MLLVDARLVFDRALRRVLQWRAAPLPSAASATNAGLRQVSPLSGAAERRKTQPSFKGRDPNRGPRNAFRRSARGDFRPRDRASGTGAAHRAS
ncbi:hypothetical protein X566_14125 [Afipia sp. P52-10]|nr:hypothetical protein X566_14125 [Afipia sp. P52-10]